MIGPIVTSAALALGGILGVFFGKNIPERIKTNIPIIFGVITMGIGVSMLPMATHFTVIVLAVILGSIFGELCHLEKFLGKFILKILSLFNKDSVADEKHIYQLVSLVAVICFGTMGIYGALDEGITGNPDILLTKSILDLFTGLVFGASLGFSISAIAVPQFLILASLYLAASFLEGFITPELLNNFSACGGIIFLATGLRICKLLDLPIINMLPALLLVLPLTQLWVAFML